MAERQIGHRKSCLVLSARFPVVNWRSRPVAKSAYFRANKPRLCFGKRTPPPPLPKINVKINVSIKLSVGATSSPGFSFLPRERERTLETRLPLESGERKFKTTNRTRRRPLCKQTWKNNMEPINNFEENYFACENLYHFTFPGISRTCNRFLN